MKLAYPAIETVFEWPQTTVPVLVVENQGLFRRFLTDVRRAIGGEDTSVVLSIGDKPVGAAKHTELIVDFLSFELNQKFLANKVSAALEQAALSEEHYSQTQELLSRIEVQLENWSFGLPGDIIASKVTVSALLKAIGISFREDYDGESGEVEKLIDYMELVREFERDKVFITVNMRNWITDEVITEFMQTVLSHEYQVLMVETCAHPYLKEERRVTIDRDLCEF